LVFNGLVAALKETKMLWHRLSPASHPWHHFTFTDENGTAEFNHER